MIVVRPVLRVASWFIPKLDTQAKFSYSSLSSNIKSGYTCSALDWFYIPTYAVITTVGKHISIFHRNDSAAYTHWNRDLDEN